MLLIPYPKFPVPRPLHAHIGRLPLSSIVLLIILACALLTSTSSIDANAPPYPPSPVITQVDWSSTVVRKAPGGDTWPVTWADDGHLYTAWGDGHGFRPFVPNKLSLGYARVEGHGNNFNGFNIPSNDEQVGDGKSGKKASGMLMVDGTLYMLVRNAVNNGTQCQLASSTDHGTNWTWSTWTFPELGYCTFINFGQDYAGARDNYVYIVSHDNPSAYQPADSFVLMRVPKAQITDRGAYEFFVALDGLGDPIWNADINQRGPVFEHTGMASRSGISYNPALGRYLWWQQLYGTGGNGVDTRFSGGFGIYDAPEPWGPWTTAYYTDNWDMGPGETASFPTKWMSSDGQSAYLAFSGEDSFSVREATFTLAVTPDTTAPTTPTGLSAATVSQSQIDLTWTAATDPESGVSSYNVYRDSGTVPIGSSVGTSFQDSGLTANTTYAYQVAAVNGAGQEGTKSVLASATTASPGNLAPIVTAGGDSVVTLPVAANLNGTVTDDGLPNPPGVVTTTWSMFSGPVGATVTFGDPTALATTAAFSDQGDYVLRLTATDSILPATADVAVTALTQPVLTGISVAPATATVLPGGVIQFAASGQDQYGNIFSINLTWSVSGGGTIDQLGLFTAGTAEGGPFTVTATDGTVSGTAALSVVSQLIVSNLTVASGKAYQVVNGLAVGDPVYIDRGYTYTGVPAIIQGQTYIQTANNDKNRTEANFLTFSVNQGVTVYVAYDSRATSLPGWLSGWANTGSSLSNTDVPLNLHSQDFSAGTITLGGNKAPSASGAGSNYSVVIVGQTGGNQAPVADAGPDQSATLMSPVTVTLNGAVTDDGLPTPPSLVTTQWSVLNGPAGAIVTFADSTSPSTTAMFIDPGEYTLALAGFDGSLTTVDQVIITVNPSNLAPTVTAGGDSVVTLPVAANLSGTVTDDGLPNPPGVVTTIWSMFSGPVGATVTFGDPTALSTTAAFSDQGDYVLRLTATDSLLSGTADVAVTALTQPVLTGITVAPATATVLPGGVIQFAGSGQDQYGNTFSINPTWLVSGGGAIDQLGLFTAGTAEGGPFTVTATDGTVSGTAALSVVSQLIVSNLTVASGKAYQVVNGLAVGDPVYIDRGYTYTGVPAIIQGQTYIQTANNDKNRTEANFLTFSVNQGVTVYVAYDSRATSLPSWLSGWANTGSSFSNTDVLLNLYAKDFVAGTIALGGNMATGAIGARSNYSVAIVPN